MTDILALSYTSGQIPWEGQSWEAAMALSENLHDIIAFRWVLRLYLRGLLI